jgi:hypothetical protein
MSRGQKHDARIKNWLSFVLGNVWLGYFTLAAPATLNPLFVTLIAALIFGPSVWGLFKEGPEKNDDS